MRFSAPLVLFFALAFLTDAASALDSPAEAARADLCCPGEAEKRAPAPEAPCAEAECRCLSCTVPLLFINALNAPADGEVDHLPDRSVFIPVAPVPSIEYPPELS